METVSPDCLSVGDVRCCFWVGDGPFGTPGVLNSDSGVCETWVTSVGDIFRRLDSTLLDCGVSKANGWDSTEPWRDLKRKIFNSN